MVNVFIRPLLSRVGRPVLSFLDRTTMYRLVIGALSLIIAAAYVLSAFDILFPSVFALTASLAVILASALGAHYALAALTRAPASVASTIITALILFLIVTPTVRIDGLLTASLIGAGSVALKYVFSFGKRHLFNPVALALVIAGLYGVGFDWWVSSRYLLPVVALAGLAVVAKTRRFSTVGVYGVVSFLSAWLVFGDAMNFVEVLRYYVLSSPAVFFAAFMLTEPLGLPGSARHRAVYAAIAGLLGTVPFSVGPLYGTPELALVAANLYTFVVERPRRWVMRLVHRTQVGRDTYEYSFEPDAPINHLPGQYLEWTLPHRDADARGVRRYLSISSSPRDTYVRFAIRHVAKSSSWKRTLCELKPGARLYATQRSGDFTLARGADHHVFIAGGIGITPFMSMLRDAQLSGREMHATLFYCVAQDNDRAFRDELEALQGELDLRVIPVVDTPESPSTHAIQGPLTYEHIARSVPKTVGVCHYYLSGPPGMVLAYEHMLGAAGVKGRTIHTDYFPGLA